MGLLMVIITSVCVALLTPGVMVISSPKAELRYSAASASKSSTGATLAAMEQMMNPQDIFALQGLRSIVGGAPNRRPSNPIDNYLSTLSSFSSDMVQINAGLQQVQISMASGNTPKMTAEINHLIDLRNDAKGQLDSLYYLRTTLQSAGVNPVQVQGLELKIDGLRRLYLEYSIQIDQIQSQLNPRSVTLTVIPSNYTVLIDRLLHINGSLKTHNGTVLAQRNVTIAWGQNSTNVLTDSKGAFETSIRFPVGFPGGTTFVTATFQPKGNDTVPYVSTYSAAEVQVLYYPTLISAHVQPNSALPLDFVSVTGNLAAMGTPLANRTVTLYLDSVAVRAVETESTGDFLFNLQVPPRIQDGNHTLLAFFNSTKEVYASSNVTLPFIVQRVASVIKASASPTSILSAMSVGVTGTARLANSSRVTLGSYGGVANIFLDGIPQGSATVSADGTFSSSLTIPLSSNFGNHLIQVIYAPSDPRIDTSSITLNIYVFNTRILGFFAFAAAVLGIYVVRRKRIEQLVEPAVQEVTPEELPVVAERAPIPIEITDLEEAIEQVAAEVNPNRKVRRSFRLAKAIINAKLGKRTMESETHLEFLQRIAAIKPTLNEQLGPLTGLFELAEYSPYALQTADARKASELLLGIRRAESN